MDAVAAVVSEHVWRSARRASLVALAVWFAVVLLAATVVGRWTLFVTLPLSVPLELSAMWLGERAFARRRARQDG